MIKIGKLADYALLISHFMNRVESDEKRFTNDEISHNTKLPIATVRKLLKKLVDAKIVIAYRGKHGGYHLAKSAKNISLLDIITAVEGTISITECATQQNACEYSQHCSMQTNWQSINQYLINTFNAISLAEMSQNLDQTVIRSRFQ
ncbi:MAG: SUF system Fe-S cluster assembly regulator [Gammaproteobacteria bacterium]|nr:SUF system Fe-S cluster assembly regulator [Gammaproteobacteria bacterium]